MVPITGWIAHRPDKRLRVSVPIVSEIVDVPDNFVKDRDQVLRVRGRASTVIVEFRISNVRFVVRRIEVDAIPARGKIDLSAETVRAIGGGKAIRLFGGWTVVIQTSVGDSLSIDSSTEATSRRIASDHTEPFGEGEERFTLISYPLPR